MSKASGLIKIPLAPVPGTARGKEEGKIRKIPLRDSGQTAVRLKNAYECNAFSLEMTYLKSLDADRLLKGFCDIGGVKSDFQRYGGWESMAIQGHTIGHYLTALSQGYALSGDKELRERAEHIISVFAQCQSRETGYLGAIPEEHYTLIEKGETKGTWVPWYTMHKILSGIIRAYELTGIGQALSVASGLGDWVYSHTCSWDERVQERVLRVEYGGMNDCLYALYSHTGKESHLSAAHSFDEISLFEPLSRGEDILDGKHANTTIPKFIGALHRYRLLGEELYLRAAVNFWDIVISEHTYITGGNSEWEHFGRGGILDGERTECNCETCNSYNMLKLTRELFKITGDVKYADYYENTFINAVLSSQNPLTGMTTYFQPMATGYFKVYSSETDHFWCCTGSGMESFTKLNDSIYFISDKELYITRYTDSELFWKEKGLTVIQRADLPRVTLTFKGQAEADIVLRVPDWCEGEPEVRINGKEYAPEIRDGFLSIKGSRKEGDKIEIRLPMALRAHCLPDNKNALAFRYGPYLLSSELEGSNKETSVTGVNVTVPLRRGEAEDIITVCDSSEGISLSRAEDKDMTFILRGADKKLTFSPHYKRHSERYGIYYIYK